MFVAPKKKSTTKAKKNKPQNNSKCDVEKNVEKKMILSYFILIGKSPIILEYTVEQFQAIRSI
jgi:hypothetical protein